MVANERLFDARGNHNEQVVDLIQLQPRLTFLQESQGKRIDADLLNKLSGGERLKERRPHGHDVEGAVTTLVCILGEAPFALSGTTGGTLERLQVCPFKKPATIDPELIDRAQDPASPEATSALLWLFEGGARIPQNWIWGNPTGCTEGDSDRAPRIRRDCSMALRSHRARDRRRAAGQDAEGWR